VPLRLAPVKTARLPVEVLGRANGVLDPAKSVIQDSRDVDQAPVAGPDFTQQGGTVAGA